MATKPWNRRQMVQSCAQVVAGVALGGFTRSASAMQLPPPEPLQDDRLTFVTTTEASPWEEEGAWMQAPIEVSRRGAEKCFRLTSPLIG